MIYCGKTMPCKIYITYNCIFGSGVVVGNVSCTDVESENYINNS